MRRRPGLFSLVASISALQLAISAGVASAQCINYRDYFHRIGGVETPGWANDIAIAGTYAYVAGESAIDGGLVVIDITNPVSPLIVGSAVTPGRRATDVAVVGNYAFVADGPFGVTIFDVTNPQSPAIVGGVDTPDFAQGIAVAGTHAFVADGSSLLVLDIGNPLAPNVVGSVNVSKATDVAVAGNTAYVSFELGLQVVDITNPLAPTIVGTVDSAYYAQSVAVSGSTAYLAGQNGFEVIDVTDPAHPAVLGGVETTANATGVTVSGSLAYVTHMQGLDVIDFANPTSPAIVARALTPNQASGVALSGSRAYVADTDYGVEVFDVTNPSVPAVIGEVQTLLNASNVVIIGNLALVGSDVIDVSNPSQPAIMGSLPDGGGDIDADEDHAYVADDYGFDVIDIENPASPSIAGHLDLAGVAVVAAVATAGHYVCVVDRDPVNPIEQPPRAIAPSVADEDSFGLKVVDVSDPANPVIVGSVATPGYAVAGAVAGSHAFVADAFGLHVIDIADPANPTIVGSTDTLGIVTAVAAKGNHAFAANRYVLRVIDVANPTSPQIVGIIGIPRRARDIAVTENYLYIADDIAGLQVIDITDPEQPMIVGGRSTGDGVYGAAVTGNYVYLAGERGLEILPTQCDPTPQAVLFGRVDATVEDGEVILSWDLIADEPISGFEIYRRAMPGGEERALTSALLSPVTRNVRDRDVQPGRSYRYFVVAVLPDGNRIQSMTAVVEMRALVLTLHQNRPNPFNPTTTISFVLPSRMRTSLAIFDVRGALVRRLLDEDLPAGLKEVVWDGRNQRGQPAASGLYFYELRAGKESMTRKMLLLK